MANPNSFFLTNTASVAKIDAIELYHPDFGYLRFQYYDEEGLDLKHEDASVKHYYFESFDIARGNITSDLDQSFSITFSDYKDFLRGNIDSIQDMQPILFSWRQYRSDDLNSPMFIQRDLHIVRVNYDSSGLVTFEASAEQLNNVKTGDSYTLDRFPTLRGAV